MACFVFFCLVYVLFSKFLRTSWVMNLNFFGFTSQSMEGAYESRGLVLETSLGIRPGVKLNLTLASPAVLRFGY